MNTSEQDYFCVIDYGEDKFAKNIAKYICTARAVKPIERQENLIEIIKQSIPMKIRATEDIRQRKHFRQSGLN